MGHEENSIKDSDPGGDKDDPALLYPTSESNLGISVRMRAEPMWHESVKSTQGDYNSETPASLNHYGNALTRGLSRENEPSNSEEASRLHGLAYDFLLNLAHLTDESQVCSPNIDSTGAQIHAGLSSGSSDKQLGERPAADRSHFDKIPRGSMSVSHWAQ